MSYHEARVVESKIKNTHKILFIGLELKSNLCNACTSVSPCGICVNSLFDKFNISKNRGVCKR